MVMEIGMETIGTMGTMTVIFTTSSVVLTGVVMTFSMITPILEATITVNHNYGNTYITDSGEPHQDHGDYPSVTQDETTQIETNNYPEDMNIDVANHTAEASADADNQMPEAYTVEMYDNDQASVISIDENDGYSDEGGDDYDGTWD